MSLNHMLLAIDQIDGQAALKATLRDGVYAMVARLDEKDDPKRIVGLLRQWGIKRLEVSDA